MGFDDSDDEGMGDSDDEIEEEEQVVVIDSLEAAKAELTAMHAELDSGFASLSSFSRSGLSSPTTPRRKLYFGDPQNLSASSRKKLESTERKQHGRSFHQPTSTFLNPNLISNMKTNYKLLHQTYIKLRHRFLEANYRLSPLQTRGAPSNAHANTVYCLQLYTYPETGKQVLFTGSRDMTIREWDLETGMVERVISGVHTASVLSLHVYGGYLASAGSDRKVGVWRLDTAELVSVIKHHVDSVLCVRFNEKTLVSCSKGIKHSQYWILRRSDSSMFRSKYPDLQFSKSGSTICVNRASSCR